MSELSAAEKAAKRAKALARLEETKRLIAAKIVPPSSTPSNSGAKAGFKAGSDAAPGQANPKIIDSQSRNAQLTAQQQSKKSGLFAKPYIEYDMSTMEDSRGGYMVEEKASEGPNKEAQHAEWLESLANQQPPYDFLDPRAPECFECRTKELDFRLWRVFNTRVCKDCRRKHPEKYSLLTKTECKQDYLLTESELRDKELLPHLERPNPYQQTYSNMMLFLRYQVEEFAWKKWGGPDQMDEEYEKRERLKKERKQAKFEAKLRDIRNRTRAQAITKVGRPEKHVHIWGPPENSGDGTQKRICGGCGLSRTEVML